jgi:hypothetical protein
LDRLFEYATFSKVWPHPVQQRLGNSMRSSSLGSGAGKSAASGGDFGDEHLELPL